MYPTVLSWQTGTHLSQTVNKPHYYVIFRIDRQHYALPLDCVARALRMAAFTDVPETPDWVLGMINMAGEVLPVIDLRRLFGRKSKDPELQDRLLILKIQDQTVAIVVDEVLSVLEFMPQQIEQPPPALSGSRALAATVRHDSALVMVLDVDRLLPQQSGGNADEGTP